MYYLEWSTENMYKNNKMITSICHFYALVRKSTTSQLSNEIDFFETELQKETAYQVEFILSNIKHLR